MIPLGKIPVLMALATCLVGCQTVDEMLSPPKGGAVVRDRAGLEAISNLQARWIGETVPVGTQRQVFYDDAVVAHKDESIVRRLGTVVKENNGLPVFEIEPWEYGNTENKGGIGYSSVIVENGIHKLWYQYGGNDGTLGYAESTNGLTWKRFHGGFFRPYIKKPVHGASVMRDENESRKSHRYKMAYGWGRGFGSKEDYGITFAHSRNGISWSDYGEPYPINDVRSDTLNAVMWDADIRRYRVTTRLKDMSEGRGYVQLIRPYIDVGLIKGVAYSVGLFMVAEPWQVVDQHTFPRGGLNEIYALYMQKYEGIYIAYVMVREGMNNHFYLAFSRSGTNWDFSWVNKGIRFVYGGGAGSFDQYQQGFVSGTLMTTNNRHYFYYQGISRPRGVVMKREEDGPLSALGYASVRVDGLAYLHNEGTTAVLRTKLFRLDGARMYSNVDASLPGASISAALRDESGEYLNGYDHQNFELIERDDPAAQMRWGKNADLSEHVGRRLSLEYRMDGPVSLYSFWVSGQ